MRELVGKLNHYRDQYYNYNRSIVSDKEYDRLYDELVALEAEEGIALSNSPTMTVGYKVVTDLNKVTHNHPMLSLAKTKSLEEIKEKFSNERYIGMLKMDGLTVSLRYIDGKLAGAETRGNGIVGEDILHNALHFANIPLIIPYDEEFIIDGEAIITYENFSKINSKLPDEQQYKHPRNLASGSVRQLDSKICKNREVNFIAWKCVKGLEEADSFKLRLQILEEMGFDIVPISEIEPEVIDNEVKTLRDIANVYGFPIDGIVFSYDSIKLGESLGATSHHVNAQVAYKFEDDLHETTLLDIEWNTSRTGTITPVAIFTPVEIDGTEVSRASLHNVDILRGLELGIGDTITVSKRNMIIPCVEDNLTRSNSYVLPNVCPCCGFEAFLDNDGATLLKCYNNSCKAQLVSKFTHFVSRGCMNIDGLSEATLEKLINLELIKEYRDLYILGDHEDILLKMGGFGAKSVKKLLLSIKNSQNCTLSQFICALGIEKVGKEQAKALSKKCETLEKLINLRLNELVAIDGIGKIIATNICKFFSENYEMIQRLAEQLTIKGAEPIVNAKDSIVAKTFVVTGTIVHWENRNALQAEIERLGGKVSGSVSGKTDYLICDADSSTSSKYQKAIKLGVKIIKEEEFLEMIK